MSTRITSAILTTGRERIPEKSDRADVAVGRFPARTVDEAKIMVDKTISYVENKNAGPWQNTVMVMGDDGNE